MAVFDTSIFRDGNKGNADLNYYYPTNDLVTAPEILFFWVARMIIAGFEYRGEMPFKNVYLTGIVRDKQGRKMSKSLGNSPDPLNLIATFGADAVRTGMLFSSPAGNDLLYDEKLIEQGRNFANKIWNAFRLIKSWTVIPGSPTAESEIAMTWFSSKMNDSLSALEDHFSKFRMSDALHNVYKLIWGDFCSWYLEMIKPEFGKPIDETTFQQTIEFFEKLLKVLHPFMPFITEELWHALSERSEKDCIIVADWPVAGSADQSILTESLVAFDIIGEVRNCRNAKGISPKEKLELHIKADQTPASKMFWPVIQKLSNLSAISITHDELDNATNFIVGSTTFSIPLKREIDSVKEREAILKDLEYQRGFLASVDKKLSNDRFVKSAPPAVIELERRKKEDAESKIRALEDSLARL